VKLKLKNIVHRFYLGLNMFLVPQVLVKFGISFSLNLTNLVHHL